jgi:branched-chain amino acid transport system ATP-binding protein
MSADVATGTTALDVRGVKLSFGGVVALDDVSLSVEYGQTVGLVGANGSGKTSLLNCISGVYHPQQGSIRVGGQSTHRLSPHRVAKLGVGRTLQSVEAVRDIQVLNYVMLGRHGQQAGHVLRYLVGWPVFRGAEADERRRAMQQLDSMGLAEFALLRMSEIPYGVAKLVDLARVLASESRVLLFDEPASGLTGEERVQITDVLRSISTDFRRAQVIVEHDLALASRACDEMVVLSAGHRIAGGAPGDVLEIPAVVEELLGGVRLSATDGPLRSIPPINQLPQQGANGGHVDC